jgi:hypothetical protein
VTTVDKPVLTRIDWMFMVTVTLFLVFGFFIIIPQSNELAIFWLIMSCLTYLPLLSLPWYDSDLRPINEIDGRELRILAEGCAKRYHLIVWLTIILPIVPVSYMLALAGTINAAQKIAIN